jgi:hypothetical protein
MAIKTLKATSAASESFDVPPAGNHPGVLVAIVDLGTQASDFQGKQRSVHEIFLCWELTDQNIPGTSGRHHLIGKRFSLTFTTRSGLRQLLEKWRGVAYKEGEEFDPQKVLGRTCLVNVSNSTVEERTYAKFEGVSPLPRGLNCPAPQNKPLYWEIESGELAALDWLPWTYGEKITDLVAQSPEWKARVGAKAAAANGAAAAPDDGFGGMAYGSAPDEIPF